MQQKKAGMVQQLTVWVHKEASDWVANLMRDLKSMRALWNWVFLALYAWMSVWLILYYPEVCGNTVVVTTGGIVSVIFTNYCFFSNADKKMAGTVPSLSSPPIAPAEPTKREEVGASD